jgi:hypothetical protein
MWALTSTAIVVLYASPGGVFDFPFSRVYYLAMLSSQISAGALFIVQQKQAARPDSVALTAQNTARKALTLAVGGMATIFLLLLIKAWTLGMVSSTWLLPADNG